MPSSAKESHHLRKWATSSPPMSHTISANEPHYLRQWVPLFHYRLSHLSSGGGCLWCILNSVSEPTIVSLFFNICFQFSHSIGWIGLDLIKFKRMLFLHFSAIFYNHKSVVHMYSTLQYCKIKSWYIFNCYLVLFIEKHILKLSLSSNFQYF